MFSATAQELRAAVASLHELWELHEPEATSAALQAMYEQVSCDFSAVNWIDMKSGRVGSAAWPGSPVAPLVELDPVAVAAHPLVAAASQVPRLGALRVSDVLSDSGWRNNPARQTIKEGLGNTSQQLERELGWGSLVDGVVYGIAVNRIGTEFSVRDRDIIDVLAP